MTGRLQPAHDEATAPRRIAVFASGGGSNLEALFEHFEEPFAAQNARIVLVLSDKATAGALERARMRGVATVVINEPRDGEHLCSTLRAARIDLIVLAGYLKLVPAAVTSAWRGRILNVHPALLPAFGGAGMYGRRVHEAVHASGVSETGVTVHFVDDHYDRGAIVAQQRVPVHPTDSAADIAARVLAAEHVLLPRIVEAVASGQLVLDSDGTVHGSLATDFLFPG